MKSKDFLSIDVGSNTTKYLLARLEKGLIIPLVERSEPNRICQKGSLAENAAAEISKKIISFTRLACENAPNFQTRCVGTSALRGSELGRKVAEEVREKTGVELKIIDGNTEAKLSFSGALSDPFLPKTKRSAFMDLGGGSLEIVFGLNEKCGAKILERHSFAIGAVRLTDRFALAEGSGIIDSKKADACYRFCLEELKKWSTKAAFAPELFAASGGALSAARIIFAKKSGEGIETSNPRLTRENLECLLEEISALGIDERAEKYGIGKNRADILPAAFLCVLAAMERFDVREIFHTFRSLRYGVILCKDFDSLNCENVAQ